MCFSPQMVWRQCWTMRALLLLLRQLQASCTTSSSSCQFVRLNNLQQQHLAPLAPAQRLDQRCRLWEVLPVPGLVELSSHALRSNILLAR